MSESSRVNRANWDERAPAHAASAGYALERFRSDPAHLSDVVRAAMAEADRAAYTRHPERPDPFWDGAEAWTEG